MGFDGKSLDDYVDVAERIAEFRNRYPDGSLQPFDPLTPFEIRKVEGIDKNGREFTATMIVYVAAAYRSQDDKRPGVGMAWEAFPGRTSFTLGSELQNAETSAWGRAIVAALAADAKRGVASRQEVHARLEEENGQDGASGGRWMNRRPDVPPKSLQDKRTPAKTTGAEQEQLRAGTVEAGPGDRAATRVKAGQNGGGGPWQDQPAGEFDAASVQPEDKPGSADSKQLRDIHTRLTRLGYTDRDRGLKVIEEIVSGPLDGPHQADDGTVRTSKNLSWQEAKRVVADLDGRIKAAKAAAEASAP